MKLNSKFILLVVLFNVSIILLAIPLINVEPLLFIAVELIVVAMIFLSIRLYRSLILPVNLIQSGIETIKDKDFSSKLLPVKQKEMDQLIDVYNKMIDQLRKERTLQQEQNFFLEKLISASPSGILLVNYNNMITSLNPAAEKILNVEKEKILNQNEYPLSDIIKNLDDSNSKTINYLGSKTLRIHKAHFIDKGTKCYFVTLEELTKEIRESEKDSYGKVIRMMSHEVNNSIGAINSIMQSFKHYSGFLNEDDKKDYENALDVAIKRNQQLNKFTKNFADVVRLPQPNKKNENLNNLISEITLLMKSFCEEKNVSLNFRENTDDLYLRIDKQQFEQVLVNIIKNSVEAIENKGEIEIILTEKELVISDNGKGISKPNALNLFKPFFSTKKNGQGVGLTIIREILSNHKFDFELETISDKTYFRIKF